MQNILIYYEKRFVYIEIGLKIVNFIILSKSLSSSIFVFFLFRLKNLNIETILFNYVTDLNQQ